MLKNWKDQASYPLDLTLDQWAWEFLRRNPDYQEDWDNALASYLPRRAQYEEVKAHAIREKTVGWPIDASPSDPEDPEFFLHFHRGFRTPWADADLGPKWFVQALLNPSQDRPGKLPRLFLPQSPKGVRIYGYAEPSPEERERQIQAQKGRPAVPLTGLLGRLSEVFSAEELRAEAEWRVANLMTPPPPPPGTIYLVLSWDHPIGEQLDEAKETLSRMQNGMVFRKRRIQKKPELWREYLRGLDARAQNVSVKKIAKALFPSGEKDVDGFLGRAREMTKPKGYRSILAASP